jgi:hypothetical protein
MHRFKTGIGGRRIQVFAESGFLERAQEAAITGVESFRFKENYAPEWKDRADPAVRRLAEIGNGDRFARLHVDKRSVSVCKVPTRPVAVVIINSI